MKKQKRINFEIGDKKLYNGMKSAAALQGRTLKYIIETAFREYLEKFSKESLD